MMVKVLSDDTRTVDSAPTPRARRTHRQRVAIRPVCFTSETLSALLDLVHDRRVPDPFLLSLARRSLEQGTLRTSELDARVTAGTSVLFDIDDNDRYALREWTITGDPPSPDLAHRIAQKLPSGEKNNI